ncbi:MAG: cytochrome c oxidase assembly protein [Lysobacterales bacterium]|jgi:putative membrane protein
MDWSATVRFLAPYQFSPVIVAGSLLLVVLYVRGLREARRAGQTVGLGRRISFLSGLLLCYAVMHTRLDYYAQYLFFMHRLQHLVLHHAGPFLIALSAPWAVLGRGLPARLRDRWLRPLWQHTAVQHVYRFLQHPVIAPILFVGLIYFWLTPAIHFDAMLSLPLYHLMNWSMLIDGLLFWWLMLNPKTTGASVVLGLGLRIVILFLIMLPQIALGAYIALSDRDLYDVYDVCGRAWPIDPRTDQQIGGLLTWIPAAMMSVLGILRVIGLLLRQDRGPGGTGRTDAELAVSQSGQ